MEQVNTKDRRGNIQLEKALELFRKAKQLEKKLELTDTDKKHRMELEQKIKECQDDMKKIIRSEIEVFLEENINKGNEVIINTMKECFVNQIMLYLISQEIFGGSENLIEQKAQ